MPGKKKQQSEPFGLREHLLELEEPVDDEAAAEPNDLLKAGLTNIKRAIQQFRNQLDSLRRLERPDA